VYILRTMMFVPGHNEKLLRKASVSEADALILDLEDSVIPLSNKLKARELCVSLIKEGIFAGYSIWIRVNDRDSGLLEEDIRSFSIPNVDGFVYPKSFNAEDILYVEKIIERAEKISGGFEGTYKLIPIIETCAAVLNAKDIALSSNRVVALAFGCEDFIADLQGIHDESDNSLYTPRAMIAMACRAAGKIPVDTVHVRVHDLVDLAKNLKVAKNLGFEGMLILNPKEIPLAREYFTPSAREVSEARRMLQLAQEAANLEKGVALLEDKFVGPPMVLASEKLLRRYEKIIEFERSRHK